MSIREITPISLLFLAIITNIIVIVIPSSNSFTEYAGGFTIHVGNTNNITIYNASIATFWHTYVATVASAGEIITFYDRMLPERIFALKYGLPGAVVGSRTRTYTITASPGDYIEGYFPRVITLIAWESKGTIYFSSSTILLKIVRG